MTENNNLETITVLTFHDQDKTFARSYDGLLNFQEGDIINLIRTSETMPVDPGNYVIRRRNIPNQMGMSLDKKSEPDSIFRYYDLEKLS